MPIDMTKKREAPSDAPKLPVGDHWVRIARIFSQRKDGTPLTTRNGDPQLLFIFHDAEGREAAQSGMVTDNGIWWFQNLFQAIGLDLEKEGYTAANWDEQELFHSDFQAKHLLEKWLWISVKPREYGGKTYLNVNCISGKTPPEGFVAPNAVDPPPKQNTANMEPWTELSAWAAVCRAWPTDPDSKKSRNELWQQAVKSINKSKKEYAAADWQSVIDQCQPPKNEDDIPF